MRSNQGSVCNKRRINGIYVEKEGEICIYSMSLVLLSINLLLFSSLMYTQRNHSTETVFELTGLTISVSLTGVSSL